jgi:hypothetical protein
MIKRITMVLPIKENFKMLPGIKNQKSKTDITVITNQPVATPNSAKEMPPNHFAKMSLTSLVGLVTNISLALTLSVIVI